MALSAGGTDYDYGMAVATDAAGNIYVTGHYYSPSIVFGNDTLINIAGGGTDIYTVKYSPAGNELWARTGGGTGFDESTTICTDAAGNIYVAGEFYSPSMTFGAQTVTNSDRSTGLFDMFIVKYDTDGNVIWARSAGGTDNDAIIGITTDVTGNIIVTGSSGSPICNFGAVTLINPGIIGYDDVFTVKYDSSGNALWGQSVAGNNFEEGAGVASDAAGNIYVTGNFSSIFIVFGNDTLYNARTMGGPTDVFLVKYDPAGNELWAKRAGSRFIDGAYDVVTDSNGDAIITGFFSDTTITFGNTSLTNLGTADIFVAKYNPSGDAIAAYGAGGSDREFGMSLSIDNAGELYIAGEFYSSTFAAGSATLFNSGNGYSDVLVAKLALPTTVGEIAADDENGILIFPNPSTGFLTVLSQKYTGENITFTDTFGKIIYHSQITSPEFSIDLKDIPKGIYFVQIAAKSKNVMNKRIVIQ